jgi:hypothetical protein
MELLAQLAPKTFWNAQNGSGELFIKIILGLLVSTGIVVALFKTPNQLRRWVITAVTFFSGLFYVLFWIYPTPINRQPDEAPRNVLEGFSFWLSDAQPVVADLTNIIAAFLIGLGIYSLLRVHLGRIGKQQRDWQFSVVLIAGMVIMVIFGYVDWYMRLDPANAKMAGSGYVGWTFWQFGRDLLFNGLLQNMDAGMFSIVAFYILSAAYRAFRARSVEATILLVTALIVMLSLMGLIEYFWAQGVDGMHLSNNFKLDNVARWLRANVQTPAIRGIDFGVGIGLLSMGVRLWLNLEKTGGSN